jgi:predicted Zn-dependent protease
MKLLGVLLFLSTACTARVACGDAVALTLPHAGSLAAKTQAAAPKVFKHEDAGIQFELPAGWTAQPAGDVLTITASDSSVSVVLWALDNVSADDARKTLDTELNKVMKNQRVTKPATKGILNGMPVVTESGTGEVDGTTIEWSVDLITAKKPVICLYFAAPGIADKHADEIAAFRNSIKKLT